MTQSQHINYYENLKALSKELIDEIPLTMAGFGNLHAASMADGALTAKTKELIALSIGIAVHCNGCIAYHIHDSLEAGATREEIVETIGVAVLMGGGPSMVYGCEALEALKEFSQQKDS